MSPGLESLPWRGPGEGRPDEIPLPPGRMPFRFAGVNRKRWRYLGAFADDFMLCAARVQVGPLGQTFWAVWDRQEKKLYERTVFRLPGARGEVWTEDNDGNFVDTAPDEGCVVRVQAKESDSGPVTAFLRAGGGAWAESVCPNGDGGYVWTRKRTDIEVEVDIRIGGRRLRGMARGVEDESAGYHPKHTVWNWSAGVGTLTDGRSVGWNLVEGVNDPPERSERAIWIDGQPFEPEPVRFEGVEAVAFADGSQIACAAESERSRTEKRGPISYSYRQPFGTFTGTLPGGLALESAMGVMEHHDARW
jgi:hypothetical protein